MKKSMEFKFEQSNETYFYDPQYIKKVCDNNYNNNKEAIDSIISYLAKR